jgi:hypothetical protein
MICDLRGFGGLWGVFGEFPAETQRGKGERGKGEGRELVKDSIDRAGVAAGPDRFGTE